MADLAQQPLVMAGEAWPDYGLIDSGNGRKLERYGPVRFIRPEPQAMWQPRLSEAEWQAHGEFIPGSRNNFSPICGGKFRVVGDLVKYLQTAAHAELAFQGHWDIHTNIRIKAVSKVYMFARRSVLASDSFGEMQRLCNNSLTNF